MAGPFALEPPNTVWVTQPWGKIRRSADGGDNWTVVSDSPGGTQCLSIDLATVPHTLYVGLYEQGIYTSTNNGASWLEANNGLELLLIPITIAVDPKQPSYLYTAARYPGGFRSTDGGVSWKQLKDVPYLCTFAVHPRTTNIVYAGGDCDRCATIYLSTDHGESWIGVYTPPVIAEGGSQAIYALAIDPIIPTNIYASGVNNMPDGQEGVVLHSTDGGFSWRTVFKLPSQWRGFNVLAINPASPSTVYAAVRDCSGGYPCTPTLYRSHDSGANWTAVLTSNRTFCSVVTDQWRNAVYAADENYKVFKSTDGGDSWVVIRQPPFQPGDPPSGSLLVIDPRVPYLYLAGMGWVGHSQDGGNTWENLNTGLAWGLNPTALALDTSTITQTLYLGANGIWTYSQAWPGSVINLPFVRK